MGSRKVTVPRSESGASCLSPGLDDHESCEVTRIMRTTRIRPSLKASVKKCDCYPAHRMQIILGGKKEFDCCFEFKNSDTSRDPV